MNTTYIFTGYSPIAETLEQELGSSTLVSNNLNKLCNKVAKYLNEEDRVILRNYVEGIFVLAMDEYEDGIDFTLEHGRII